MKRGISLLGSTGSIGRQTLEVVEAMDGVQVVALTARNDVIRMEEQVRTFKPELAVMTDQKAAADLNIRLRDTGTRVLGGVEALEEAATHPDAETVVTAVVGMVGLMPTLAAIGEGKRIALANKETLVCGGELVMEQVRASHSQIIPVDSEHSALFQSLQGCQNPEREIRRLILTCSGGPFLGKTREELENITKEQALRHPKWSMGAKISIDSATLMNKGLEWIEAMHLFQLPPDQISIVIHPESVIHSLVEYQDYAMVAQLGTADMRLPIQYALTWPQRLPGVAKALDLLTCGPLTFQAPDRDTFSCLKLAEQAARQGGNRGAVLNGANEAAVDLFLQGKCRFLEIEAKIQRAMEEVPVIESPKILDLMESDLLARKVAADGKP